MAAFKEKPEGFRAIQPLNRKGAGEVDIEGKVTKDIGSRYGQQTREV
jgi:hypothetical protein